MNAFFPVITQERDVQETQLEELTKKYLLEEINLDRYREEIARLKVRLDLRRMASKIKITSPNDKMPE